MKEPQKRREVKGGKDRAGRKGWEGKGRKERAERKGREGKGSMIKLDIRLPLVNLKGTVHHHKSERKPMTLWGQSDFLVFPQLPLKTKILFF